MRNAQGQTDFILSSNKDVTPLKVICDAKLVDARFRDLLESVPDGIVMVNLSGRILIANARAEAMFGYQSGELNGKSIETLLPERLRGAHVDHRSNYFTQPRSRPMGAGLELYGLRKDNTEFPVEISLSPLRTEEGTLAMSAIRDVTERKRFERALQEKNLELANANQAKDRFLASMSHELRTPLNAIIGFTGTMLMKLPGPLTADQEKQLRTVQSSAKHLLTLINELLDVAKIGAGKTELYFETVDCRSVAEEVATVLRPEANRKGIALEVTVPAAELAIRTDRRALRQIVLNLAGNAVKFTEGGSVRIAVSEGATDRAGSVEIGVTDTGIGIRPEDHVKLFEPFTQLDVGEGKLREGTGLGLHLSQKLAELLGGRITFQSEYGKGSTFTLTLIES